jgi:RND family efflux transporter MFP subunit
MSAPLEPPETRPAKGALAPVIAGVALLIGAGVLAFGVLGGGGGGAPAPKKGGWGHGGGGGRGGPVPVSVVTVEQGELSTERLVPGELVAKKRASLRAEVGGQVKLVPHRLGAVVKAGALLVSLDPGSIPAELKRAEAQAEVAKARANKARIVVDKEKRDLARFEALQKDGAVSAGELDGARTAVMTAEADGSLAVAESRRADADVEALSVRLKQTRVVAPFTGRVAAVHVDPGTVVSPGANLVEVVDNAPPIVRFSIAEGEAGALLPGASVVVSTPTGDVDAKIARVGAAVDVSSRTLPVEATLEGDSAGALPGMFVEVALSAASPAQALLVPLDALVGKGAQRKVFVVGDDNKAHARDVVLLLHDGKRAAVRGVEAGVRVITAGAEKVREGADVEVIE